MATKQRTTINHILTSLDTALIKRENLICDMIIQETLESIFEIIDVPESKTILAIIPEQVPLRGTRIELACDLSKEISRDSLLCKNPSVSDLKYILHPCAISEKIPFIEKYKHYYTKDYRGDLVLRVDINRNIIPESSSLNYSDKVKNMFMMLSKLADLRKCISELMYMADFSMSQADIENVAKNALGADYDEFLSGVSAKIFKSCDDFEFVNATLESAL